VEEQKNKQERKMKHKNTIKKTGEMEYTCRIYVPLQRSSYGGSIHYCYPMCDEKEIERDETGNIIECEVYMKKNIWSGIEAPDNNKNKMDTNFPSLFIDNAYDLINKENVDDIFWIYKEYIGNRSWELKRTVNVIGALLNVYGDYNSYSSVFNIIKNQKGYGYMGGTGCGKNVHHLTFDKIVGVKENLPVKVKKLAEFWLAGMLQILNEVRESKKYLRDIISEKYLYVTIGARPDCQNTVAHVNAHGFPVKEYTIDNITCKKCLKRADFKAEAYARHVCGSISDN
jgi:hypothetical protein